VAERSTMALAAEQNEAFNPVKGSLFGTQTVVPRAQSLPDLIQQSGASAPEAIPAMALSMDKRKASDESDSYAGFDERML